jgi:hypothetical protein
LWWRVAAVTALAAGIAILLHLSAPCIVWLSYPKINVTVFNESTDEMHNVRIKFFCGERVLDCIPRGRRAVTEVQSAGESGVFLSYKGPSGTIKKDLPLHYSDSSGPFDRGFVEVHITDEGTRIVKRIYVDNLPWPSSRIAPAAQMRIE